MRNQLVKALAIAAAVATVGMSGRAEAQMNPVKIGFSGGASIPVSDQSDVTKTGYTLTANIGVRPVGSPFTLQAEGGWNQWDLKNTDGNFRSLSLTGNLLYDLTQTPGVKPYVIGTVGYYHLTSSTSVGSGTFSESSDKAGLGIGGGIRLPMTGFDTYIEARYTHVLDTSVSFVPITFGIRF